MGEVALLAVSTAVNPTLLAATTVMVLLPRAERLMVAYWTGAMLVSVSLGVVIVFALRNRGVVNTTKNTVSPAADFVLAAVAIICGAVLARAGDNVGRREKRKSDRDDRPSRWQQAIGKGTARVTFVIGVFLSLPGFGYLAGLDALTKLHYPAVVTVVVLVGFNLVQFALIEVPIVGFKVAPEKTAAAVAQAKNWGRGHARIYAARGLLVLGVLFAIKGVVAVA
jgi:Sap, sulfolipid-1-addressing protein